MLREGDKKTASSVCQDLLGLPGLFLDPQGTAALS